MRETGWYDLPNVTILEGRWQDFIGPNALPDKCLAQCFDAIYWDTFSEHYRDLHVLFEEIPNILEEGGRFSWFHGLGATNPLFYDVSGSPLALALAHALINLNHRSTQRYRNCI